VGRIAGPKAVTIRCDNNPPKMCQYCDNAVATSRGGFGCHEVATRPLTGRASHDMIVTVQQSSFKDMKIYN